MNSLIPAAVFIYFASLSGAIAFGGLLGEKTGNLIGISETLVLSSLAALIFAPTAKFSAVAAMNTTTHLYTTRYEMLMRFRSYIAPSKIVVILANNLVKFLDLNFS